MSNMILELISNQWIETILPVVSHVHKRIERFVYVDDLPNDAAPVVYLENRSLDSWIDLQIANRTYSVPANGPHQTAVGASYQAVNGNSISSIYKDVLITNKTYVDEYNVVRPLFYKHRLPANTTEATLTVVESGNKLLVDTGFVVDLVAGFLYTNYNNFYDPITDAYKLFFITSSASDGTTEHQLLNPESAASEATWEDLVTDPSDSCFGHLKTDIPVYSRESGVGGYVFYLSTSDRWYLKPLAKSLIQPLKPGGRSTRDPWFMRFTNGDVTTVVNNATRRYYLPEFNTQPFMPYKPIVFSPYTQLLKVNRNILTATRDNINIDPDAGLHLTIFVRDPDNQLIRVFTTDQALDGTIYSGTLGTPNTSINYEADKIVSWDNAGGFISLGIDVLGSWSLSSTYYYNADDFEYKLVTLNPIINKKARKYTYVFYLIPDVNIADRALHHLLVDDDGTIIETSQGLGLSHPNLKLRNPDTSYNTNTIVGTKYISDVLPNTFVTDYTAGLNNNYGYMIVAEVGLAPFFMKEDQFDVNVQRPGQNIDPDAFASAIEKNPRILQSRLGYGEDGQEMPENLVMVLEAPLSLTTDYGGNLEKSHAETLLRSNALASGYTTIKWTYPVTTLTGYSDLATQAQLNMTWEGPGLTYKIYRWSNPTGPPSPLTPITTIVSPIEGNIQYLDTGLVSGDRWHYAVTITSDGIEYPATPKLHMEIR